MIAVETIINTLKMAGVIEPTVALYGLGASVILSVIVVVRIRKEAAWT